MATMPELTIDEEFLGLCPDLSPEELSLLETSIEREGCRNAIVVWDSGGKLLIVDGHNRHRICRELGVAFKITKHPFDSREEAANWIITNQLGQRNLTEEQKIYLRGKRYHAEKKLHGAPRGNNNRAIQSGQNEHFENAGKTAEKLGQQYGVSPITIRRNARVATQIDRMAEAGGEVAKKNILSGAVKIGTSNDELQDLEAMTHDDLMKVSKDVAGCEVKSVSESLAKHGARTQRANSGQKKKSKPQDCTNIIEELNASYAAIQGIIQRIEATGGKFESHRFDLEEQLRRLRMARKLIVQVRSSVKGD